MSSEKPLVTIIYSPFPDGAVAQSSARTLLSEKLIACANVLPGATSLYWWEGAITESTEVVLIAKTTAERAAQATTRLAQLHPYATPAIVQFSATADAPYAMWIHSSIEG